MIPKPIDHISHADLQALVDNVVQEGKTIEYKRDLPSGNDKDKHSFLSAISSFANTEGGDLIYGIEAMNGIPVSIPTIGQPIEDEIRLRLENMSRTGIEPRLPAIELKFIPANEGMVLVVRVSKSWMSPHRVTANGSGHFYGRHSAGKFQMDVSELRTAFNLSESVAERISMFRSEQASRIFNHDTPIGIHVGCKMIFHVVPLSAFASSEQIDLATNYPRLLKFSPFGRNRSQNSKINLQGVVNYANLEGGRTHAYTQITRRGIVESVVVFTEVDGAKYIHSKKYEQYLLKAMEDYLPLLAEMGIVQPFYVFLSLVDASEYSFRVPNADGISYIEQKADQHMIFLPEIVVTDITQPVHKILQPVFDMVWNAFGYVKSENYNDAGNWID